MAAGEKNFANPIQLNGHELRKAVLYNLASAPSSPTDGWVYYDTALDAVGLRIDGAWFYISTEHFQDLVGAMVSGNVETGISVTYDDTNGKLDFALTDEYLQDLVGAMVSGNSESGITVTYDDTNGKLDFSVPVVDQEVVEDYVGGMVTGNTETGITVTYDDGAGKLNFVVATLNNIPTATGDVALGGFKLTNVADGVAATDAATVGQVQAAAAGLAPKDAVRAATTGNITIATALNNGDTLDGVTLATGDRVLVKDQSAPAENGIYIVGVSPSRATDFDSQEDVRGAIIPVEEGTTNANRVYLLTTDAPITIDTTGLSFTLMFNPAATAVQRYATDVGDGASLSYVVTHNLGTRDVSVTVRKAASPYDAWEVDWEATSTTQVTVYFATAPASSEFRVVVLG